MISGTWQGPYSELSCPLGKGEWMMASETACISPIEGGRARPKAKEVSQLIAGLGPAGGGGVKFCLGYL